MRSLPGWMKMRSRDSIGYHFINALVSQEVDRGVMIIDELEDSVGMDSPDVKSVEDVYYNVFNTTEKTIGRDVHIEASLPTDVEHMIPADTIKVAPTGVTPIVVDRLEGFIKGAPTRLSFNSNDDVVVPLKGKITGLSYVKDWYTINDDGLEVIEKQDVIIINQDTTTPCPNGEESTIVFDKEFNILEAYDYGIENQSYNYTGKYEVINDVNEYKLEFNPLLDTVIVYDYINLDPNGNAQVIPIDNYSIKASMVDHSLITTISMSGMNPYNDKDIAHSNYFIDYKYKKFKHPMTMTTQESHFGVQKMASPPLSTSRPSSEYVGTKINVEPAISEYYDGKLLRINPKDVRPGSTVNVKFKYTGIAGYEWDAVSRFVQDISTEDNYVSVDSKAIRVIKGGADLTQHYDPKVEDDIITIEANVDPTYSIAPPYDIMVYYYAEKDYGTINTVQSFSDVVGVPDPYPQDYMLDNDALIPYTMLPISDDDEYIKGALYRSGIDDFEITSDLLFTGIAYDQDKDCYWMVEGNNLILYRVLKDGRVMGKWNIFKRPNILLPSYKTFASGVIDPYNDTSLNYTLVSQSKDIDDRMVEGMVYYRDFLYILSRSASHVIDGVTIGGSGIWRMDTYEDRLNDIKYEVDGKETYPHYPYSVGLCGGNIPVDISIDTDGNFLIAGGKVISKVRPHYDYALIDSGSTNTEGKIYYREGYRDVTIDGFDEVS